MPATEAGHARDRGGPCPSYRYDCFAGALLGISPCPACTRSRARAISYGAK
jgi:hypothetical protein